MFKVLKPGVNRQSFEIKRTYFTEYPWRTLEAGLNFTYIYKVLLALQEDHKQQCNMVD